MLSMNVINNLDYYCRLANEDYYHSGGEPAGIWAGLGARLLGLQGEIDTSDYKSIFRGYSPNGMALCEKPGAKHRTGWDFTFSAPKSVSVIWARSEPHLRKMIQEGQLEASKKALSFLEQHAAVTRRGHGGHQQEHVTGLVAALFEHSTSRAQDPQLHTHCLVANAAPRIDGSWGTLESRKLFMWQKAAGAIYRANLANHLCEIGFQVEQPESAEHFEIKGVPEKVCRSFSKRAEAIESALEATSAITSASKIGNAIKLTSRSHKQHIDRSALFKQWHKELDGIGLTIDKALTLRSNSPQIDPQPLPTTAITKQVVEKNAVFRLQDLYAAVAQEAQWQHTTHDEIESTVNQILLDQEVVFLGMDAKKNQLYSTPEMIELEKMLIRQADSLQQQMDYRLSEEVVLSGIRQQAELQDYDLSIEQTEAVFNVCNSGLDILQGAAGSGKSTSMQAVKIAYEAAGFAVLGASVARQAANQLENETGIPSTTIAKLLSDLKNNQRSLKNSVLLVDEAGQLSSINLVKLIDAVSSAGGKLILVGEQQQLDAITHAGSLRFLSQRQGCTRIETIRRQRERWSRKAVKQLRAGNTVDALKTYKERGLLNFGDGSAETRAQLVEQWKNFRLENPDKQTMILAQRWRDVRRLNSDIREVYQAEGTVGDENIEIDCAVSTHSLLFQFSRGERVRFCRNDYRLNLTNGLTGTIKHIERRNNDVHFIIKSDEGRQVSIRQSDYCDDKGRLYLSQAYASTVYSSQGTTVDGDVFVYYTTGMDRSASYVAGSRHKDKCHWFFNREELDAYSGVKDQGNSTNDRERTKVISRCMNSNNEKFLAIEYLQEAKVQKGTSLEEGQTQERELEIC